MAIKIRVFLLQSRMLRPIGRRKSEKYKIDILKYFMREVLSFIRRYRAWTGLDTLSISWGFKNGQIHVLMLIVQKHAVDFLILSHFKTIRYFHYRNQCISYPLPPGRDHQWCSQVRNYRILTVLKIQHPTLVDYI